MKYLFGCLAIVALAAGCATPPPYIPSTNTYAGQFASQTAQVSFVADVTDPTFAAWMPIVDFRHMLTNDGYDKVEVKARNTTVSPMRLRYRFEWQNAAGEEVRTPGEDTWEKLGVSPGRTCTLTSIAPKPDCAGVRLLIKNIIQ